MVTDEILAHAEDPEAQAGAVQPDIQFLVVRTSLDLTYLGPFYDRRLITDVLRKVKGGKRRRYTAAEAAAARTTT